MKKLTNTTEDRIEVVIDGSKYVLEPKGSIVVTDKVAMYWAHNLHKFLVIDEAPAEKVVEKVTEVVEETEEESKKEESFISKVVKTTKKK